MTADEVIQSIDDNYAPLSIDAKISIDELLAQLIRSTLEAAADRMCDDCTDCTVEELEDVKPTCRKLKAILAPLAEGGKP